MKVRYGVVITPLRRSIINSYVQKRTHSGVKYQSFQSWVELCQWVNDFERFMCCGYKSAQGQGAQDTAAKDDSRVS